MPNEEAAHPKYSKLVRAAGSVLQAGDGSMVHTAEMSIFSVAFLEMQELMWSLILATTFRFWPAPVRMWGGKKWEAKELRIEFQEEGLEDKGMSMNLNH